jgi:hypothetical protein
MEGYCSTGKSTQRAVVPVEEEEEEEEEEEDDDDDDDDDDDEQFIKISIANINKTFTLKDDLLNDFEFDQNHY